MTEEDIKVKVILPYLAGLGFQPYEIQCEVGVEVRLGVSVYKVEGPTPDPNKRQRRVSGRIDFLVTRNGRNIAIIEAKRDDSDLTSEDLEQADSYGALVRPIPPVTIVTNGRDWVAFKTLDRNTRIAEEKIEGESQLEVSVDGDSYYKALKCFLGYSEKNILQFSHDQVRSRMRTLTGDSTRKYIPELYQECSEVKAVFNEFLASDDILT